MNTDSEQTYYEILGVKRNATDAEIKSAWRDQMKNYHPDIQHENKEWVKKKAEEETKKINAAYNILKDPKKRRDYDNSLDAAQRNSQQSSQQRASDTNHTDRTTDESETFKVLIEAVFSNMDAEIMEQLYEFFPTNETIISSDFFEEAMEDTKMRLVNAVSSQKCNKLIFDLMIAFQLENNEKGLETLASIIYVLRVKLFVIVAHLIAYGTKMRQNDSLHRKSLISYLLDNYSITIPSAEYLVEKLFGKEFSSKGPSDRHGGVERETVKNKEKPTSKKSRFIKVMAAIMIAYIFYYSGVFIYKKLSSGPAVPIEGSSPKVPDKVKKKPKGKTADNGVSKNSSTDLPQKSASIQKTPEKEPTDSQGYTNRGILHARKGQHDKAITDLTKAIELNQGDYKAYCNRGEIYKEMGEHAEAIKDADAAIKLFERARCGYSLRGLIAYENGETDDAIFDLGKICVHFFNFNDKECQIFAKILRERAADKFSRGDRQGAIMDVSKACPFEMGDQEACSDLRRYRKN